MTFSQECIATHIFEIGSTLIYFLIKKTRFDHLTGRRDISTIFVKILTFQGSTKKCQNEDWCHLSGIYFNDMIWHGSGLLFLQSIECWSHLGFEFMGPLKKLFFSYYFHIDNRWCTVHVRLAYDKDSLSRVLAQYRYLGMCYPQEKMLR